MSILEILGAIMMFLAILLFFTAVVMCVVGVLKEDFKRVKKYSKIGFAMVPLFFIGLLVGTFGMSNYWERHSSSDDKENQEIMENIRRNEQIAEEESKKREEAERIEREQTFRLPEESKSLAQSFDLNEVRDNIKKYVGSYAKFKGQITDLETTESYSYMELSLSSSPDHVVIVEFPGPISNNIGDVVTAYGFIQDGDIYTTSSGSDVYVPILRTDIIE
jgi:ABC-type multidrug transport system fused ATPase/permease subunit